MITAVSTSTDLSLTVTCDTTSNLTVLDPSGTTISGEYVFRPSTSPCCVCLCFPAGGHGTVSINGGEPLASAADDTLTVRVSVGSDYALAITWEPNAFRKSSSDPALVIRTKPLVPGTSITLKPRTIKPPPTSDDGL